MDKVLSLFSETIAGSAETVARAADERQRAEGLVEAPNEHAARAALLRERLRERLRAAHGQCATAAEQLSADDAKVLLGLTREVLGGLWRTLWDDYSAARDEAVTQATTYVRENPESYVRRGVNWAWGVLGRSLGVGAPETY
jgi:predicted RNA-binding Zn ribbon-like protein